MSKVFSLTSSEMQKEGSERRKKNPLALGLTPVNQYLKFFRKGTGNTVLDCETYCYHSPQYSSGSGDDQEDNCGPDRDNGPKCKCKKSCGGNPNRSIRCNMFNSDCTEDGRTVCCCKRDKSYCRMLHVTNYILALMFEN